MYHWNIFDTLAVSKHVNLDFPFFNISHPSEVRSKKHRKQVRSHVTATQHRRKKIPVSRKVSQSSADTGVWLPEKSFQLTSPSASPVLSDHTGDSSEPESKPRREVTPTPSTGSSTDSYDSILDLETGQVLDIVQAAPHQVVPHPGNLTVGKSDPFTCHQVPWHSEYDKLLHYMMTVFAPRAWPSLNITNEQGHSWENFMTLKALEEPALLYVRLLFASGELIKVGGLERDRSYSLQLHAIKAINEALSDHERCISDGLILAVGRIALHESMYGDRIAANQIHRPAQRRMISLRGGITKLGFPDLVTRLMRWSDRVMSIQGSTERLLPDEEDQNNETFGMQQSLRALEAWAPEKAGSMQTGQASRKTDDGP